MTKPNKLAIAVRNVILSVTGVALIPALALGQEAKDDKKDNIEEVFVTGSHIKRSNFNPSSQVVVMDEAKIDAQASLVMSDVLRASPLNSYGSFSERSGSSAQSNATIDLRGLGAQRTLVTIDGRRMVGSPNLGAAIINVNMIPNAAVKSVDILADGAAAAYGSDAVAGVVNMQMHDKFEGMEFKASYGDRSQDEGGEFSLSLLGGMSGDRGNITFSVEKSHRDPIWDRDREYTSPWTRDTGGDGTIDAYHDTDGYSIYGASIAIYDTVTKYDAILAANSCSPGNGFLGEVDADKDWGSATHPDGNSYCMYGYADVSANKAELDKINTYVSANYELTDNMELYVRSLISRVESFGRFAPPAAAWENMPEDYADVPFDIQALLDAGDITVDPVTGEPNYEITGYYRWTNIGPRDNFVTDTQTDFTFGLRGDISENVSYDIYAQDSSYDVKEYGYYYLSYTGLDYVMANGVDPFSPDGAGAMSATTTQDNFSKMRKVAGTIQFGTGDWFGAGETLAVVGGEYFEMRYQNKYDRNSEFGYVGGSSGNSSNGEREVSALFGEMLVPMPGGVEVSAAVRYDNYSDFGSAVSPTLSANWAVTDQLTLRTRIGQGFRAPGLDELYGPETFSAESASDQLTCANNGIAPEDCGNSQYDTYYSTNPDLDAETSDSFSLGANWRPLSNLTFDIGYWDISIQDKITQPDTQNVFYAEAAGVSLTEASGTYVDRSGGRPTVYATYVNAGELSASGVDFQINSFIDTKFGTFSTDFFLVYTSSYKQPAYFSGPSQETSGFNLQPEYKGQWSFGWEMGASQVDFIIDYTGPSSQQDFIAFNSNGDAFLDTSDEDLDSWTTMLLSYSYDAAAFGKIKVGARNLTDEDPVLDRTGKFDSTHYDLYDNTGRVLFLEYTLDF